MASAGAGAPGRTGRQDAAGRKARAGLGQLRMLGALGCGGVLGAESRYAISLALPTTAGGMPWGTFSINVSGSAALGLVLIVLTERLAHRPLLRTTVATGIIGAYTTFSTFAVEAVLLVRGGHAGAAALYLLLSVVCGLLAAWAGMAAGRLVLRNGRAGGARQEDP